LPQMPAQQQASPRACCSALYDAAEEDNLSCRLQLFGAVCFVHEAGVALHLFILGTEEYLRRDHPDFKALGSGTVVMGSCRREEQRGGWQNSHGSTPCSAHRSNVRIMAASDHGHAADG
jgi:hypothetical protein